MGSIDLDLRCAEISALDEPLPGTTAAVQRWLCLEHRGAWGRDVLDGTAFGPELTAMLRAATEAAGVRLMLMHRPGRSGNEAPKSTVLLANSTPEQSWCETLTVSGPSDLLDLDLTLLAGDAPGLGTPVLDPVTLVCTHGKRDVCCALWGRPIAASLAAAGQDVWECSHTGGHRFAPSMISLPTGYSWGRLDALESVHAVTELAAGRLPLHGLRGRGCWDAAGQAAEIAVRGLVPDAQLNDLDVTGDGDTRTVGHADGRRWSVDVALETLPARAVSCGASPKPVQAARVLGVTAL
ncbi:sucrase ferredoxin [Tomitella biformata]|uniref:sucrase ferredoxin n=1 Tax=Tomitella biformata TaxID=630403 RepID=UPI0004669CD8|nr:sucrase ferredoxin [Tomitella biformata]